MAAEARRLDLPFLGELPLDLAVRLAGDVERLRKWRRELRPTLKASRLGQTKAFAADFYKMLEAAVAAHGAAQPAAPVEALA